ncbi:MAG: PepSY-associated TM helix domain-containing protein [Porticoccaceae bacterium]
MSHRLRKTFIFNQKWHRKIGLGIMAMVAFLAVSGLMLNHSPDLGLASKDLTAPWLLKWYGLTSPELSGVRLGNHWISHPGGNELFVDDQPVASCQAPLLGAASYQAMMLALCRDGLVMLTAEGELLEKLDTLQGLPEDTEHLQVADNHVLLGTPQTTYNLNLESLTLTPQSPVDIGWSQPGPVPRDLAEQLLASEELPGISLETLILDLHSGRFFGNLGVWFVDLVGILLCILAITGLLAWNSRRRLNAGGK